MEIRAHIVNLTHVETCDLHDKCLKPRQTLFIARLDISIFALTENENYLNSIRLESKFLASRKKTLFSQQQN